MFFDSLIFTLSITFFVFALAVVGAFSLRGRKRHTKEQISDKAPVVVTSTTHTAPGGYPVTQMPPATGYQQQSMYPPYPTQTGVHGEMPMPMPVAQPPAPGIQPYVTPYPPMPAAAMNPPSYDAAVAGVGTGQPNNASSGYEKQAPYNPHYNAY
ncbi:PREDICTED: protein shisa-5 isoform X2 [Rhagoletis zephyria]|uniref:protein shisa-5 isoform X2 n=1 Tax=Rhagoletis zephyria TaxID=28612 RepID=UPI000811899A|nr:PREDICTED: protein shisa-5 isoform X2 [Rhagoletis zephyria]